MSLLNGGFHGGLVHAFHADDLDVGPELFQPAGYGGDQSAAADGDTYARSKGLPRSSPLHPPAFPVRPWSPDRHRDGQKVLPVGFRVLVGGCGRLVIAVSMKHDLHVPAAVAALKRLALKIVIDSGF